MDELFRLFDALQFHEEHGEVCPAGWTKGDSGMKGSPAGVASYLLRTQTSYKFVLIKSPANLDVIGAFLCITYAILVPRFCTSSV